MFTNNTNPSEALVTLAEIAGTQWTEEASNTSNNIPTGVEFGQAARLLHASVQRIQQPSMREFQDVSQTLTAVRQIFTIFDRFTIRFFSPRIPLN